MVPRTLTPWRLQIQSWRMRHLAGAALEAPEAARASGWHTSRTSKWPCPSNQPMVDEDSIPPNRRQASRPDTAVTYFLLFRSIRLIVTVLLANLSAWRCSAASAFAAFFFASFSARCWASIDREAVAASRASGDHISSYRSGCFFSSHSWHFLTVPPYSQN